MQFDPCAIPHELHFKPSEFYLRLELRTAKKKADAVKIGLFLVREVEVLTEFIRNAGLNPPTDHLGKRPELHAADRALL
jgi:hypothetical protein